MSNTSHLSDRDMVIINAAKGKRVTDYDDNEIKEMIMELIAHAAFDSGVSVSNDMIEINAVNLISFIKDYMPSLTFEQVRLSFKMGSVGTYGDFNKFSLKLFVTWIRKFMMSDEVQEALKKYKQYEEEKDLNNKGKCLNNNSSDFMIKEYLKKGINGMSDLEKSVFEMWCCHFYDRNKHLFKEEVEFGQYDSDISEANVYNIGNVFRNANLKENKHKILSVIRWLEKNSRYDI